MKLSFEFYVLLVLFVYLIIVPFLIILLMNIWKEYYFMMFVFGMFAGVLFLEPLFINTIYFSNLDLFNDLILTKKNSVKLKNYYKNLKD